MNKRFLSTLTAGVVALAISGAAAAADQPQDAQQQTPAAQPSTGTGSPDAQRDADREKNAEAYFAAMSKCDALEGVAEKQQCVDSVRKQYGQM